MTDPYIELSAVDLLIASLLLVINFALSAALKLGLGKRLAVATVRMTAQLLLVGLILEWVFRSAAGWSILGISLVMGIVAGVTAVRRSDIRFPMAYLDSVLVICATSFIITGLVTAGILRPDTWWEPQYLIPLLGMLLGNALTGISLGLDTFLQAVIRDRDRVEGRLMLGATRWEAALAEIREALRVGLIPVVNSMLVMGIVSLPGMMTGQILAGADPVDAVRYQILIMFMIAGCVATATFGVVLLAYFRVFSSDHRLKTKQEIGISSS